MFEPPPISPLATHFWGLFSRTEYALKRCKEFRTQRHGYVEANWPEFVRSKRMEQLYQQLVTDDRAQELIEFPPKHLIVVDEDVRWSDQPKRCADMTELATALRDLRNNLFHGEKGHESDRDRQLLLAGTYILNKALEISPNVVAKFYSPLGS